MTSLHGDGIGLALVLRKTGVNRLDDVGTDRGLEDGRQGGSRATGLAIGAEDGDGWSGRLKTRVSISAGNSQFV